MPKRVAIFDYDHTLILGDSFWAFLIAASGRVATGVALAAVLGSYMLNRAQNKTVDNLRTFVKSALLKRLIAGRRLDMLESAAQTARRWQKENAPLMQVLRDHHAQGDTIVVASGGLNLYLPELLRDIPHNALICTDIGVTNGIVTGIMVNGNCVRQRKAERVGEWLAANGPFDESFGYGNYPHDVPMLNLVKHRIIVS
jgi:phosphatidylglycerophosphatase C